MLGRFTRHSTNWRIGVLFMIGSACFAVASLPTVSSWIPGWPIATIYFVGSLFFTSAGLLQFRSANGRADLAASGIQFIGTLLFNVSTAGAFLDEPKPVGQDLVIWTPDVWGSAAFLISSGIAQIVALRDVKRGVSPAAIKRRHPNWPTPVQRVGMAVRRDWREAARGLRSDELWIATINLAGSIAFGLSALAAFVVPNTGELLNAAAVNTWTLLGALCFFAAAFLLADEAKPTEPGGWLSPERKRRRAVETAAPTAPDG